MLTEKQFISFEKYKSLKSTTNFTLFFPDLEKYVYALRKLLKSIRAEIVNTSSNLLQQETFLTHLIFLERIVTKYPSLERSDQYIVLGNLQKSVDFLFLELKKQGLVSQTKRWSFFSRNPYQALTIKEIHKNITVILFALHRLTQHYVGPKHIEQTIVFIPHARVIHVALPLHFSFYTQHKEIFQKLGYLLETLDHHELEFIKHDALKRIIFFCKSIVKGTSFESEDLINYLTEILRLTHQLGKQVIDQQPLNELTIIFAVAASSGQGDYSSLYKIMNFILKHMSVKQFYIYSDVDGDWFVRQNHSLAEHILGNLIFGQERLFLEKSGKKIPVEQIDAIIGFRGGSKLHQLMPHIPWICLGEYDDKSPMAAQKQLGLGEKTLGLLLESHPKYMGKEDLLNYLRKNSPASTSKVIEAHYNEILHSAWVVMYPGCPSALSPYLKQLSKPITLFIQSPIFEDDPTEVGFQIVQYSKLPSEIFTQLIYSSDYPVWVTGDQSVTEAIQCNQPFVYNVPAWKKQFFIQLIKMAKGYNFSHVARFLALQNAVFSGKTSSYAPFFALYQSSDLHKEFRLFLHKLQEIDFALWPILAYVKSEIIRQKNVA